MTRKTFISYKYNEARDVRDRIIKALGDDATYYKGETSDSPDMTDHATETIKSKLKDMLFDTTVTIVVISPNMKKSEWIDWEIEYSLREYERSGRKSHTNGVVGVIMEVEGEYSWIKKRVKNPDGHVTTYYDSSYLYGIIEKNRLNQDPKEYVCERCRSVDGLDGGYIALVTEGEFIANPDKYIENAYEKSQRLRNYDLCKTR